MTLLNLELERKEKNNSYLIITWGFAPDPVPALKIK
jgi:hypothetical protein